MQTLSIFLLCHSPPAAGLYAALHMVKPGHRGLRHHISTSVCQTQRDHLILVSLLEAKRTFKTLSAADFLSFLFSKHVITHAHLIKLLGRETRRLAWTSGSQIWPALGSAGELVKTQIAGFHSQRFPFSGSGVRCEDLNFYWVPRWGWCPGPGTTHWKPVVWTDQDSSQRIALNPWEMCCLKEEEEYPNKRRFLSERSEGRKLRGLLWGGQRTVWKNLRRSVSRQAGRKSEWSDVKGRGAEIQGESGQRC